MKKFGYFILIFVPLILSILIQSAAAIYSMLMAIIIYVLQGQNPIALILNLDTSILLDKDFNGMIMIFYSLTSICLFGLWYYFRYEGNYLPLKKGNFKAKKLLCFLGIAVLIPGVQFGAGLITSASSLLMPKAYETYETLIETAGLDEKMTFIMFMYSVILAPICEELIFRGVTFSCAKRLFSFWPANFIQAILFGVFHMNLIQGIYAFALGLILGYVCEKGKSIYFSLFLHFLFNLWAATMTLIFNVEEAAWLEYGVFPIVIISLVFGLALFRIGLSDSKKNSEAQEAY